MGSNLRSAVPEDLDALKAVYREAFGDPEPYINRYFSSALFQEGQVMVLEAEGHIQAAFHCLSGPSLSGRPLTYLYALGTRTAARGRGYGAAVVRACAQTALEQGAPACLCPASPSLHRWYAEKAGAKPLFSIRESFFAWVSPPAVPADWHCTALDSQNYIRLRELLLAGQPHVSFPARFWDWQSQCCRDSGGGLLLLTLGDRVGAAIVQRESPDELRLKELLLPEGEPREAAALLSHHFGARRAAVRSPLFFPGADGEARPFIVGFLPTGEMVPKEAWWGPVFD